MSTTTPNLTLTLYDSTTDQSVTFATFRAVWGGTATTSNFYRIDTWAGTVNSSITTLQNQRGAIPVSASYISANYYEATVSSIASYTTGMTILLKLDTDSAGTVTLNINSLGTKSVTKVNGSGTIINISGGELQSNRYYLFVYDGTQWVWVNAQSSDQVVVVGGTSGNVLTVSSSGAIDGTTTQSLLLSQTIHAATSKTTPADSDEIGTADSAASYVLKKLTWSNLKTDVITALGALINSITAKTTPVGADELAIGDSAASNATKKVALSNLYKALGTGTQDATTFLRGDGTYAAPSGGTQLSSRSPLVYTSNTTWTKPSGLVYILVEVIGGGGAGGGAAATSGADYSAGSGGNGGGYSKKKILNASLSATETVTVGAGGTGVSGGNGNGGGTSSFGTHLQATGGGGGIASAVSATLAFIGSGSVGIGSNGDLNSGGDSGSPGVRNSLPFGGSGGGTFMGGGGEGGVTAGAFNGSAGKAYGGGGAGSANAASQTARAGGAGAAGVVVVWEYVQ